MKFNQFYLTNVSKYVYQPLIYYRFIINIIIDTMESSDLISSNILSNVNIIADIYNLVKKAAFITINNKQVQESENDTCTLTPYINGIHRTTTQCTSTNIYKIRFNSDDIVILGGSALNIYDNKLKDVKVRRQINALEKYIKKKTSDIDIVWWPRPSTDNVIITSQSSAIINLVNIFAVELNNQFAINNNILLTRIRPYIPKITNSDALIINVSKNHILPAGVHNINITFHIKDKIFKICDIAVHDSGSSQKNDLDGNIITHLQYMFDDPVYCSPVLGYNNSINYININNIDIAVPNIYAYIEQQMFAFDNVVRVYNIKGLIYYKRIEFIKQILLALKLNDPNNIQNYTELKEVFKTDSKYYILYIIAIINIRINKSINNLRNNIIDLCKNIKNDFFVSNLCEKATNATNATKATKAPINNVEHIDELHTLVMEEQQQKRDNYISDELTKLNNLQHLITEKSSFKIKNDLNNRLTHLYEIIEQRKYHLIHMSAVDLLKYRIFYNTYPDDIIQEFKSISNTRRTPSSSKHIITNKRQDFIPYKAMSYYKYIQPNKNSYDKVTQGFYGFAKANSPPSDFTQVIYNKTGRQMKWNSRGWWYYSSPPLPPLPPLPSIPLPSNNRKNTKKNNTRKNNTRK